LGEEFDHGWTPIGSSKSTGNLRLRLLFFFSTCGGRIRPDTSVGLPALAASDSKFGCMVNRVIAVFILNF